MPQGLLASGIARIRAREGRSTARFVDMCVVWQLHTGERVLTVGGVWDRERRAWSAEHKPRTARVIRFSAAQHDSAAWMAQWFRSYLTGDWTGMRRAYSALLYGGRRSGKTWEMVAALLTFAVARASSTVLCTCTTQDGADEVHRALVEILARDWYQAFEDEARYVFANGSEIKLSGAGLRTAGKQGAIDFVAINEAQLAKHALYVNLRGAIGDTGGLVLLTANPPQDERGRWVEEHWEGARDGTIDAREFFIDRRKNPHVDHEALDSMARELDPLTYAREIEGKMGLPSPRAVFYAWTDEDNIRAVPAGWLDCTEELTRELLKQPYAAVAGSDFDKLPYLATSIMQAWRPPAGTTDDACWFVVDHICIQGTEDDVLDEMVARGWTPDRTVCVGDASGSWQDVERTRGRTSFDYWKARGYRILKPDSRMEKNPDRRDRERCGNAMICNADGERRLFVVPGERTLPLANALKRWQRKESGKSDATSDHAHRCDSVTYPLWRMYGRRLPKRKATKLGRPSGGSAARPRAAR